MEDIHIRLAPARKIAVIPFPIHPDGIGAVVLEVLGLPARILQHGFFAGIKLDRVPGHPADRRILKSGVAG